MVPNGHFLNDSMYHILTALIQEIFYVSK